MHPEDAKRIGNRWWRITHLYKIRTKTAGMATRLDLNPVQADLAKKLDLWPNHLILKARQQGVSTLLEAWHLDATMHTPNCNTVILAHEREALGKLFQIVKFAYESCPDRIQLADGTFWVKPVARYETRNELYFEGLNSSIYVSLKVRSTTVHRLHVSEWAFLKNAEQTLAATFAAVPRGGIITGESTANGMGGSFYEEWENEDSRFWKHFYGYQEHPDYCDEIEDDEAFEATLTDEERDLMQVAGMKLGNIAWRRRQLSVAANRKLFDQEYPYSPAVAFLTSGRSPFDRAKIQDWIIREPIETKMEGRMLYWVKPVKGRRYIVGCDAASGRGIESLDQEDVKEGGTDYDVVQVWDCETLQLCAQFRGKWPYAKMHHLVYDLHKEYNGAYTVVEATDHGLTILNNLVRDYIDRGLMERSQLHTTQYEDAKTKKPMFKYGFYTNLKTRPLILDLLAGLIDDQEIVVYSRKMQSEAQRFIIDDNGDMRAMDGYHDDTILCAAFTLYCIPHALKAGRMVASKKELGLA